jgi:E3 ubiquitin-protein ligase SHPRH
LSTDASAAGYTKSESQEKELESFRATFNRRVGYFAPLEEMSHSVSAPGFKALAVEIAQSQTAINDVEGVSRLARIVVNGPRAIPPKSGYKGDGR